MNSLTIMLKLLLLLLNFGGVQSFQYTTPIPATTSRQRKKQNFVRIQCRSSSSNQLGEDSHCIGGMKLNLSNNNNDNDNNNNGEEKGIPFLASALGISAILAAWPLLTFLRDTNNPTDGFDIDMFMALKGMLDTSGNIDSSSNMSRLTDENYRSIVQLPSLSPAEQLVAAFFGPPR